MTDARNLQDRLSDFLEVGLDRLVLGLLALVALYPTGVALLFLGAPANPPITLTPWDLLWYSDAGGQMGFGPALLRSGTLLAGMLWLIRLRDLPPEGRLPLRLAAFFYGVTLISAVRSSHPHDALLAWSDLLNVGLVTLVCADFAYHSPRFLARLPFAVLLLVGAVVPANYLQFLTQPAADEQMRGAFFHPNIMASYLILLVPILLSLALRDGPLELVTVAYGGVACLGLACIALSFSRAGQILMLASLLGVLVLLPRVSWRQQLGRVAGSAGLGLVAAFFLWRGFAGQGWALGLGVLAVLGLCVGLLRSWSRPGVALIRLVVVLGLTGLLIQSVDLGEGKVSARASNRAQTLAQGKDNSLLARVAFFQAALAMALDHPVSGVGPAGFQRYYPSYQMDLNWFSKFVHNLPLTLLCETGFPGAVAALLLALCLAWGLGRRILADPPSPERDVRVGVAVGVGLFLAYSCFDVQWEFRVLPLTMGMLLGVALGTPRPGQEPVLAVEDEELSPWRVRPQVLGQHTLAVTLLALLFCAVVAGLADERARLGRFAMEHNKPKEAALFYRQALAVDPWQGEFFRQCALAMLNAGLADEKQKKEALSFVVRTVELDSHRAVGFNLLGRLLLTSGRQEEAHTAFRRALELDPINYPSFYIDLANLYNGQNDSQARQILDATVARFPEETFLKMFDFRANSIRNQLAEAYLLLGDLANPEKNPKLAEQSFAKAVELNRASRLGLFGLGLSRYHGHDLQGARTTLQALARQYPDYTLGLRVLAATYGALGQTEEARAVDQRILELEPPTPSPSP